MAVQRLKLLNLILCVQFSISLLNPQNYYSIKLVIVFFLLYSIIIIQMITIFYY